MNVKKLPLIVLLAFLLFWLFQDPTGLADSSETLFTSAWQLVAGLFDAMLDFVTAL